MNQAGRRSVTRTRQLYFTAAIVALAAWIAFPFLTPITWALILAIAEWPLVRRALSRWPRRPGAIAIGFALATGLLMILPLSLAAVSLAQESQTAFAWLQHAQHSGVPAPSWLGGLPLVGGPLSRWWQAHLANASGTSAIVTTLSSGSALAWMRSAAAEVARDSVLFLVTLVILAAILARGEGLASQAQILAGRMLGGFGEDFVTRMTQAVRSTVNGTLLVSFGEGALIGCGYAIAGVPQPLLFTILTITLALVPFGAWAAFGLASLILIGSGAKLAGLLLFAGATIVMLVGDNVVQPAAIGSAVKLPFILALMGAFGGLAALGLVGLFIGPVVMAALQLVLQEWLATASGGSKRVQTRGDRWE
jgi:predicted PurR-regulated permease PerM